MWHIFLGATPGATLGRLQGDNRKTKLIHITTKMNFESIDQGIEQILSNGNISAKSIQAYHGKVRAYRAWVAENAPEGHQNIDEITNESVFNICRYMQVYRDSTSNKYSSYE